MIDWHKVDTNSGCIAGVFDGVPAGGIKYFPTVINGVLEESGLYLDIKDDISQATMFATKGVPTAAWLYVTYLLKTSICYVEYKGQNGQLKKMLLCSNPSLLTAMGYKHHFNGEAVNGGVNTEIKAIKVNNTRLTLPRTPMFFKNSEVRVVPLALLHKNMVGVQEYLRTNSVVRFTYYKDNGSERTLVSTQDINVLLRHYTVDTAHSMLQGTSFDPVKLRNNGFIRLPELGASRYDSGLRALNIAKIARVEVVSEDEVDFRFVDVDFSTIVPTFKHSIQNQDIGVLCEIAGVFGIKADPTTAIRGFVLDNINRWVDNNVIYGSTQFLRQLYLYMQENPVIFATTYGREFNINMGVNEGVDISGGFNIEDGGTFEF